MTFHSPPPGRHERPPVHQALLAHALAGGHTPVAGVSFHEADALPPSVRHERPPVHQVLLAHALALGVSFHSADALPPSVRHEQPLVHQVLLAHALAGRHHVDALRGHQQLAHFDRERPPDPARGSRFGV